LNLNFDTGGGYRPTDLITSVAHIFLLFIGFKIGTPAGWAFSFGAISLISFCAWIASYRRQRFVSDMATSRVASAAQGYAELYGRAEIIPGDLILTKFMQLPCVWYRYIVEERSGDDWKYVDSGCSEGTFAVVDNTGECIIDPDGAEVLTTHKQTWRDKEYRYTEWVLLPKEPLYVIGQFTSIGGSSVELNFQKDLNHVLSEWKKNKKELLERFDLNKDGQIDMKEWMLARQEAKRVVEREHQEIRARDSFHIMRQPEDGRLYLLSNLSPEQIAGKYRFWTYIHITIFLIAGAAVLFTLL
jgi:hypothetical protein